MRSVSPGQKTWAGLLALTEWRDQFWIEKPQPDFFRPDPLHLIYYWSLFSNLAERSTTTQLVLFSPRLWGLERRSVFSPHLREGHKAIQLPLSWFLLNKRESRIPKWGLSFLYLLYQGNYWQKPCFLEACWKGGKIQNKLKLWMDITSSKLA